MRRADRRIDSKGDLSEILRQGKVCYLAMVDEGRPYVVPLNYGYEEGSLYFHSAPEGRKIDVLGRNPEVCFSIVADLQVVEGDKACSWSTKFRSINGTGRARILEDRSEKEEGLAVLMAQYSDREFEFTEKDLDGVSVIRVEIEEISGKSSF